MTEEGAMVERKPPPISWIIPSSSSDGKQFKTVRSLFTSLDNSICIVPYSRLFHALHRVMRRE